MQNAPMPLIWLESTGADLAPKESTPALSSGIEGLRVATWTSQDPGGTSVVEVGPVAYRGSPMGRWRRSGRSGRPLQEVLGAIESGTALAVVPGDTDNALRVVAEARRCGLLEQLWVGSTDLSLLQAVRGDSPATRLLHGCDPAVQPRGAEQHAAALRGMGIQGVMVPIDRVSAGLVALMHRFDRIVGVEGVQYARMVRAALTAGVDIVCGPSCEVLREART